MVNAAKPGPKSVDLGQESSVHIKEKINIMDQINNVIVEDVNENDSKINSNKENEGENKKGSVKLNSSQVNMDVYGPYQRCSKNSCCK